jgi:hypothetical protein
MAQVIGTRNSDGTITVIKTIPAGAKKTTPVTRNAPVHHSSKPISDGRVADAIMNGMPKVLDDPNGPEWTITPVTSKKGHLTTKTRSRRSISYGRRSMSVYQAKSLGSSMGVVAPEGMVFTSSPQDVRVGHTTVADARHGKDAIQQNKW